METLERQYPDGTRQNASLFIQTSLSWLMFISGDQMI